MTTDQEFNRLRWRCRRGMRELDALLMRFLDIHYMSASPAEQAAFRELLSLPDPDILGLLTAPGGGNDSAISGVLGSLLAQRVS